nr:hypothetical protein CFP56_47515 [Quercus suber]
MTLAPFIRKGSHLPTHLPRRKRRIWMWIGDRGVAPQDERAKSVGDENHPVEEAKPSEKVVDKEALVD